jgi:hypothetical protein
MTNVMNLGVPSWGSLTRERLTDDHGKLRDDYLIPLPHGDAVDAYFELDEYAKFAWYFPSTVFFFSGGQFTYRVFSAVIKPLGFIAEIDAALQKFVSSVHDESLLPKSDKATKLARELKPLKNYLLDIGFHDIDVCRIILAFVIVNPVCPTKETVAKLRPFALEAQRVGAVATLYKSISALSEPIPD